MTPGERISALEPRVENVETLLTKHVSECAAMQKKVLVVVIFLSGWTVAHSPEAAALIGKILKELF